jgi:uncharacterized iron-regulated membrane protein
MIRRLHRIIGLVMLLPFVAWAATGLVFFTKPGYGAAYDPLAVRTYPLGDPIAVTPDPSWREMRYARTILGVHLIVRTAEGWSQLDPATRQPLGEPAPADVRRLIADAFAVNPARYGQIASLDGRVATTDTGAVVTLDWNRLSLQQRGRDTDRIDRLYKIHYLQWTGEKTADRILGLTGLVLLLVLTGLGAKLAFRR